MDGMTLFFVLLGAGFAVVRLMKLVEYLDTPCAAPREGARSTHRAARESLAPETAALALERARLAAGAPLTGPRRPERRPASL